MNVDDVYPSTSQYLAAADLKGRKVRVFIEHFDVAEFKDRNTGMQQNKVVLSFHGKDKKLALNKKNAKMIASMYGDNFNNWIGKEVTIFPTKDYFGKDLVDCIRVEYVAPQRVAAPMQPPAHRSTAKPPPDTIQGEDFRRAQHDDRNPPPVEHVPAYADMNDEIPF